ncbi:MAG: NAD(P)-binding domain-containing protein [Myxococcota bacterium]
MDIAIFGTGTVARELAAALLARGHQVALGTRDPATTRSREAPNAATPGFADWQADHPAVRLAPFAEAAAGASLLINATGGAVSLDALAAADLDPSDRRILLDVSNPLDFSQGFPPSLTVCNTASLGEAIQAAYPSLRVVKALNTVAAPLMVNPKALAEGEHTMLICGDDADAKAEVAARLRDWFGWRDVVDVGDMRCARGLEAYLLLWTRLYGALGTPSFSIKLVR